MPASTTQANTTKQARKPARKPAAAKASRARTASSRATQDAGSALRQTQAAARADREVASDYAERAVLIPVGAALMARDRVVSTVTDTFSTYSSPTKTQAQLRRFERRGATARNRLEREVRKARVRVERELRERRRDIEKTVRDLEARRDSVTKNGSDVASRVQERILNLV